MTGQRTNIQRGDGDELVTVDSVVTGRGSWQPVEGEELISLLDRFKRAEDLPNEELKKIRSETLEILSRCIDPGSSGPRSNTGLVIGRIQSGKTMSFTAVAAAAKDNGFDLIVIMGGTTNILISQTRGRLGRDLGLAESDAFLRWDLYESMLSPTDQERLRVNLSQTSLHRRKTVLVTLMKHYAHINGLADALEGLDLSSVSALLVDDEADQHSLNTATAKNEASTTYRSITRLRKLLPRHSFLQYTATPQAPLLVALADALSPDWTALLTPGRGYVGGATYFQHRRDDLIRVIPEREAQAVEQGATDPPASLIEALHIFLLTFAAGHPEYESGVPLTRSMMVHPHPQTWTHELVMHWLSEILSRIRAQLAAPKESPEYQELVEDFGTAHHDLSTTVQGLPPLDDLLNRLRHEITGLRLQEVNSLQDALDQSLRWNQAYGWILVGAEMLNRGFTVKGLTVTYMPRSEGSGNADTLAQRARFYGYRQQYLEYCRVYLRRSLIDAYTSLVDTEERVREDLETHMREDGSLKSWRRRFLIDPNLRPTRQSVIAVGLIRARVGEWFDQRFPAMSADDAEHNRRLATALLNTLELRPMRHEGNWGEHQQHSTAVVPLARVLGEFLVDWRTVAGDRQDFEAVVMAVSEILVNEPNARAEVVLIDGGRARNRGATEHDAEGNPKIALMQGRSAEGARLAYPGDRNLPRDEAASVTIQVHHVNVSYSEADQVEGLANQQLLPMIAVRLREGVNTWLTQM